MKTQQEKHKIFQEALSFLDVIKSILNAPENIQPLMNVTPLQKEILEKCLSYYPTLQKEQDSDIQIALRLCAPENERDDIDRWRYNKIISILEDSGDIPYIWFVLHGDTPIIKQCFHKVIVLFYSYNLEYNENTHSYQEKKIEEQFYVPYNNGYYTPEDCQRLHFKSTDKFSPEEYFRRNDAYQYAGSDPSYYPDNGITICSHTIVERYYCSDANDKYLHRTRDIFIKEGDIYE